MVDNTIFVFVGAMKRLPEEQFSDTAGRTQRRPNHG